MMKKSYILFIICLIIIICIIITNIFLNIDNKSKNLEDILEQNKIEETENQNEDNLSQQKIDIIKDDLGYNNTNTNMYEIKKEYDGREVIVIKPNIQYKVAMAGAIKNGKPEFSEIDGLLEQAPNKSGIWIEKNSRKEFVEILQKYTYCSYTIDEDGYLVQEQNDTSNEIDNNIKKAISNKKNYSICINSVAYLIDEVTGNIEEYPFEEIDPEQSFELFETENASLYVITSNTYKRVNYKNIIEEVLNNMII